MLTDVLGSGAERLQDRIRLRRAGEVDRRVCEVEPRFRKTDVLDGMRCAIPQAEALVRIAARKPSTGSYAPPGERQTSALDPALAAMLGKRT